MTLPAALERLAGKGFTIGPAFNHVATEEQALAQAQERHSPEAIRLDADQVATQVAAAAFARGVDPESVEQIVRQATSDAIRRLTQGRDERIEFHQRSVEQARSTPTTWVIANDDEMVVYVTLNDKTGKAADPSSAALLHSLEGGD